MAATIENESEILLGNKQLLAVFAVVAILLAVAFTGGYMLGKSSTEKKPEQVASTATGPSTASPNNQAADTQTSGGPITQRLNPDSDPSAKSDPLAPAVPPSRPSLLPRTNNIPRSNSIASEAAKSDGEADNSEPVLGRRSSGLGFPKPGETFVQVAAVSRREAEATADVLRQHQFKARVAPAPGNLAVFRVLVGPAKDAAALRDTEDELRKIGYTKCFPQHY